MEGQCLAVLHSTHTEVEPSMVVPPGRVWKTVSAHPASIGVGGAVLGRVALSKVARVEFGRDYDATGQVPCVLLGLPCVHLNLVIEDKWLLQR